MSSFNFLDDEVSEAWPVVQLQSHHPTYIYIVGICKFTYAYLNAEYDKQQYNNTDMKIPKGYHSFYHPNDL